MAFSHRERCSCGAEVEVQTDRTSTKDPDFLMVGAAVKEWRQKHSCQKPTTPYVYPSTGPSWGGGVQPYPPGSIQVTNGPTNP